MPEAPEPRLPAPLAPRGAFDAGAITDLAAALAAAERPLLLAGRGAWLAGAGEVLGELAEATGALTATTALGRGVFPDGRYDLGVAGGFGAQGAMELVREADVAVVFGASLNQFTMRFGELFAPGTRVVQVDVAPAATHPHVGGFVRGRRRGRGPRARGRARARGAGAERLARDGRRRARPAPTTPGDGLAPDGRLDPRTAAAASPSCCPRTASSSPTAGTSSAGRTCTGRSPPPTG